MKVNSSSKYTKEKWLKYLFYKNKNFKKGTNVKEKVFIITITVMSMKATGKLPNWYLRRHSFRDCDKSSLYIY